MPSVWNTNGWSGMCDKCGDVIDNFVASAGYCG